MKKLFAIISLLIVMMSLSACGIEQVDEGYRGIETNWGKVVGEPLKPGLWFYNPISSDIFEMDVKEQKYEGTTTAFTKDTQSVSVTFVLTFYPKQEKIGLLYSQFGKDWAEKTVSAAVLGSMKDAIGRYIADELVQKREEAKAAAQTEVITALDQRHIVATRLDFVNLDFDDAYEKAVEAKVVATQRAAESKNRTVQIEEEAKQKVKSAEADARAMQIKSQALSQNQNLVSYELVQKWNGVLPSTVMGNSIPLMNFDKLMSR